MTQGKITIKLHWYESQEINQLDDFFKEHGKEAGVYFWIYKGKPERICYIGETRNFEQRFHTHFTNIAHGLYTAVDCTTEEDMVQAYKGVINGERTYYKPEKQIYFQRSKINEQIEDIKEGISLKWKTLQNTKFLFAKFDTNKEIRKQVEAVFMTKLKTYYDKLIGESHWNKFDKNSTNFWGEQSRKIKNNFVFISENIPNEQVLIDIKANNRIWEYTSE